MTMKKVSFYDSAPDTWKHIHQVQKLLMGVMGILASRLLDHDQSKLKPPEKEVFDKYTPLLWDTEYGSKEYKQFMKEMRPAIEHHNAANSHHPEHFEEGIKGMSLLDLIEMLCDWKAATLRHKTGDIRKSVEMNQERFGYSDELKQIFLNTVKELDKI